MKKILKFLFICVILFSVLNCENDNVKFNGSPEGKLLFETITGTISTAELYVLPGQEVKYIATLPASFRSLVPEEVTVEATSYSISGGIRTSKLVIPAGQLSATGSIVIGGGAEIFDTKVQIKLTAINLSKSVLGKQFILNSNVLDIDSGSSSIPTENSKRMRIFVSWENKFKPNVMKCVFARVGSTAITFKNAVAGSTNVGIANVNYAAVFNTDLPTTALNFVTTHGGKPALIAAGIMLQNVGNSVIIRYPAAAPIITVSGSNTAFSCTKFDKVDMAGADNSNNPRVMDFYVSEIIQKNGKSLQEAQNNCFNEGKYSINFQANSATALEPGITNLKYRIAIRFPDGTVKIFNGIYNNISFAAGPKEICTFEKNGFGQNAVYSNFVFN